MYPTAEVRWFYPGPIPPQVATWFNHESVTLKREPVRVDRYLRPSGFGDVNVKLREGRIEVKRRVGESNRIRFHPRVTGVVERWRKWSFELTQQGTADNWASLPVSSWIPVRKNRSLRTYEVTDGEVLVARSALEAPADGCELELTRIVAFEQVWWTLAFEAFGDEDTLRDNLRLVATHVLGTDEPPRLDVGQSQGYAAWLIDLLETEAQP